MKARLRAIVLSVSLAAVGCGDSSATTTSEPAPVSDLGARSIILITHDSFAVSETLLEEFTETTGVEIRQLRAGDVGAMVNQVILTKDNPLGDVLFGIDNTFLSRATQEGIFEPYSSPLLDQVPAALQLSDQVTPIDFGDVCLNYDKAAFESAGLNPPQGLRDLTKAEYAGMLVVQSPATSSPGLAFLLATIAEFGESGDYTWKSYWEELRANDVQVTSGWEEAYFGAFSATGGGDRPIVVSYASSPPAEVIFAEDQPDEAPTAAVLNGCFRQIEFAGILTGTSARPAAEALIDFMLTVRFQEDIPLNMFVFPANENARLPDAFIEHTSIPEVPLSVAPADIEANRSQWIDDWFDIVVR